MVDYNKIAEFIVQNAPGIVPEYVGEQLAEAEADIFTWLKGTERTEALKKRAAARNWLKETARRLGYTGELEPEELVLGEEMVEIPIGGEKPSGRTWPAELAWREKSGFGELHRPFPETYGDWVNLAENIKEKMPPESWNVVNDLLHVISQEEGPVAEEAKRWLMKKAGELRIE